MKCTHSFLDAIVCCLLALPISLATDYPYCSSNGAEGCECTKQIFACDPFGPDVCGSIYMSPDKPDNKVNVPGEVAKDAFAISSAIFSAGKGNPFGLIALPFKLVNNGKAGDDNYNVDDAFVDAMKLNVQNYVAQAVSQAQMEDLYDGIVGNNDVFKIIAEEWDALQNNKEPEDEEDLQTSLLSSIHDQRDSLVQQYPKYASKTPTIHPTITPTGSKTGPNGWGIFYSAFVDQLLLAFLQDIAVTGIDRLAVSIVSQQLLVEYGWKAIKHANILIDTYVAQRESDITGPTSPPPADYSWVYYEIKDSWVYYHEAEGSASQTCSWDADNYYGTGGWVFNVYLNEPCDQSTVDFVKTYSTHCKEGRKQFVTGSIINNWNTWLIEPAKQWAKLVDLICASADTDDESLQRQCTNQGETKKDTSTYKNNGGTASDYINNKEEVIDYGPLYVLGPENTNDCPPDSSHVIERDQCQDAYNQLAPTMEGLVDGVDYVWDWGTDRPSGCFLFLTGNTVNFNSGINNESGASGDTLGGDRPICRRTFFVLGPKNTNDCPLGSSHVLERDQCQDAYNQLATTMEGLVDSVDYEGTWDPNTRPSGCFLTLLFDTVFFDPDINTNSGDTLAGGDQPICYSYYPRKDGYIIQQTCQKNYPGGNVIATPVPCVVNGCDNYYKSNQPDASETRKIMPLIDACNAGLSGWTCCLDSSWDPSNSPSQTPSSNPSGSPVASTSIVQLDNQQQYDVTTNMKKTSKKSKK